MGDEDPEVAIPESEEQVIHMAGAEIDEEKALAVAQARLIGDL